jgi:hypothetical protein
VKVKMAPFEAVLLGKACSCYVPRETSRRMLLFSGAFRPAAPRRLALQPDGCRLGKGPNRAKTGVILRKNDVKPRDFFTFFPRKHTQNALQPAREPMALKAGAQFACRPRTIMGIFANEPLRLVQPVLQTPRHRRAGQAGQSLVSELRSGIRMQNL